MRLLPVTVILLCCFAGCSGSESPSVQPAGNSEPVVIHPAASSVWNDADNIDSPAVWHGPNGEHWIIATAKTANELFVYDAETAGILHRVGAEDGVTLSRPNGLIVFGDDAVVVERDAHRVQVLSLPDFTSVAVFGEDTLVRPYGLYARATGNSTVALYVTDNYETPEETVPPDDRLGARVKRFDLVRNGSGFRAVYAGAFGDTTGNGVLHVVESIWGDPVRNILLIADEDARYNNYKVYSGDGVFTGTIVGAGVFSSQPEGIVLAENPDGSGWWIAIDQFPDTAVFHVFDRATFAHAGAFTIEGVANTDGIALSDIPFGPFADGIFVAVDDDGGIAVADWRGIKKALDLK